VIPGNNGNDPITDKDAFLLVIEQELEKKTLGGIIHVIFHFTKSI
jgi:hypothetical protein